jgi:hypothetical protein
MGVNQTQLLSEIDVMVAGGALAVTPELTRTPTEVTPAVSSLATPR